MLNTIAKKLFKLRLFRFFKTNSIFKQLLKALNHLQILESIVLNSFRIIHEK